MKLLNANAAHHKLNTRGGQNISSYSPGPKICHTAELVTHSQTSSLHFLFVLFCFFLIMLTCFSFATSLLTVCTTWRWVTSTGVTEQHTFRWQAVWHVTLLSKDIMATCCLWTSIFISSPTVYIKLSIKNMSYCLSWQYRALLFIIRSNAQFAHALLNLM